MYLLHEVIKIEEIQCQYCNKYFKPLGIKTHIWRCHTDKGKNFKTVGNHKEPWNKGLNKSNNTIIAKAGIKCSISTTGKPGRPVSEETKEKLRIKRFEYLSKKLGKTGWEKSQQNIMTYLENKFYREVILKYNLLDKYNLNYNYPLYPYFLDFAFININFIVELDGACHFNNGIQRIEHDIKRDKYLLDKGWKTFRIAYNDNFEDKVIELLNILDNVILYIPKTLDNRLYLINEQKIKEKDNIKLTKILNKKNIIEDKKKKIIYSKIEFSKWGWVKQTALILEIHPQKVKQWMIKNLAEFYQKECFKRK